MSEYLKVYDIFLVPAYLLIIYVVSTIITNREIGQRPHYKYFRWGLFAKLLAGLVFCSIYLFYYEGGDTLYYYSGSKSLVKLIGKDFSTFLSILFGNNNIENYSVFDSSTGWPIYYRDSSAFSVVRFSVFFIILGLGSFLGTTIVLNTILYIGIWQFLIMLTKIFQNQEKKIAIAVLFIPSLVFWGSGLLKDIYCLAGSMMIFVVIYRMLIERKKVIQNFLLLILWSYVLISIRPFTFYTAFATAILWIAIQNLYKIRSPFLRTTLFPVIISIVWIFGSTIIIQVGEFVGGRYQTIETMLETASIIQDDLRKEYYGGNRFDIGPFEPTIQGILRKFPQAITAGLFRPFLWESKNIVMVLSGIENMIILALFIYLILRRGLVKFINTIRSDAFLIAAFVFTITFGLFVGLATANFGALVRYRIPILPFFTILLLISLTKYKRSIKPE